LKKFIVIITLLVFTVTTVAAQNPATPTSAKPPKEKISSTAIWIGLGVVLFVAIVAANKRRRNKK
jgi:carbohydrate-binding DOMON domain-containing protein